MPSRPRRPCMHPGCTELVAEGSYCEKHKKAVVQRTDERRPTAAQRGYDSRWRKAREGWLRVHPLCVMCEKEGRHTPATVVDHIKPHKGDKKLFWDKNNWQSLCKRHHDTKTAAEDGGFGNNRTCR